MQILKTSVGNALQDPAAVGHVNIFSLLLQHKPSAVVSAPGGRFGSALLAAICSDSSDNYLCASGRDGETFLSKAHGRPLEKAADMGHWGKEIVKDLQESKAEADLSPQGEHVYILHKAAMYGMQELASYCIVTRKWLSDTLGCLLIFQFRDCWRPP